MSDGTSDLGNEMKRLKTNAIQWIVGTVVLVLVVVAIMCLSIFAPRAVEDSEVADLGPDADSARLQLDDYQLGNAPELSVRQQNDRLHEQAQGYAERYQMAETHTVNRSKAFVLEKERGIDIHPQIDEFSQAHKEWDNLISGLLVSDEGKRLAQNVELIEGFIELYSKRPMRPEWANAMRRQLDILLQPVIDTIPHKYSQRPGKELEGEVRDVASKVAGSANDIKRGISIIRGLVARAPRTIPAGAPSLAEAIIRYDASRHSKDFLDARNVKKQAEEEAKRAREQQIRQKQKEAMAISEDLNRQANALPSARSRRKPWPFRKI